MRGYPSLSPLLALLQHLFSPQALLRTPAQWGLTSGLGARVGRITNGLLLKIAKEVDVIEPVAKFTEALIDTSGVRNVYTMGIEDWEPEPDSSYGLVWIQWCAGHLTDEQFVAYLKRCASVLNESGVIVVKENMATGGCDKFDEVDSSVTR